MREMETREMYSVEERTISLKKEGPLTSGTTREWCYHYPDQQKGKRRWEMGEEHCKGDRGIVWQEVRERQERILGHARFLV